MSTGPQQFKLLYRGNTVWLPPGELFVGRSCACHVVIEDPLVSRRHAQVTVTTRHATIEDLNSINGVYVNGERLTDQPLVLRQGDRVQIGNEELLFEVGSRQASRHTGAGSETISGVDPVVPADSDAPLEPAAGAYDYDFGPASGEVTTRVDALVLLGEAADRALNEGYVGRAEQMLSNYLTEVLNDATAGKSVLIETVRGALTYGLKLAWATRNGTWFDYVVALLNARRMAPPQEYVESLHATLQHVGPVNMARLQRYVDTLQAANPNPDTRQQEEMYHAHLLLQAAQNKQVE